MSPRIETILGGFVAILRIKYVLIQIFKIIFGTLFQMFIYGGKKSFDSNECQISKSYSSLKMTGSLHRNCVAEFIYLCKCILSHSMKLLLLHIAHENRTSLLTAITDRRRRSSEMQNNHCVLTAVQLSNTFAHLLLLYSFM